MISFEDFQSIAHRTASRYSHRSEPEKVAYTFLPHTLEDFHRQVCAAIQDFVTKGNLAPEGKLVPAVPEGWKLVPVEPTQEMLYLVGKPGETIADMASGYRKDMWTAMLSEAPQPAQQVAQQEPAQDRQFECTYGYSSCAALIHANTRPQASKEHL
jgi:hypothetical protein